MEEGWNLGMLLCQIPTYVINLGCLGEVDFSNIYPL